MRRLIISELITSATTAPTLLPVLKPKLIFTHISCLERIEHCLDNLKQLSNSKIIVYGGDCDRHLTLERFIVKDRFKDFRPTVVKDIHNTAALIMNTSGSTGVPKGVMLSHKNLGQMTINFSRVYPKEMKIFTNSPCYWSSSIHALLIAMYSCSTVFFTKKSFEEINILRIIEKFKIDSISMSCFHLTLLNQHPDIDNYDLSSVRVFVAAGSRLSQDQIDLMQKRLVSGRVVYSYGLTEMAGGIGLDPMTKPRPGSVGKPLSGISLKVVDINTGIALGPEQEGEIYMRGPSMLGYYGDEEATREVLDPVTGWLRTGDLGHYDRDGYVYIADRIKEIGKYRGNCINPCDIEDVLLSDENIRSASVVMIPHDETCDLVVAYVEPVPEAAQINIEELEDQINDKLEDHQKIRGGIHIVKKLPTLTHGKIARPMVKKLASSMSEEIVKHYKRKYAK